MRTFEYGVIDDEDFVIAPGGMSREEAIRMACTLGDGHDAVRRACEGWERFNTGIVDPCAPYAR